MLWALIKTFFPSKFEKFPILLNKACCDPSLEPFLWDGFDEGSQHAVLWRNKKKYLKIILKTPSYLEHSLRHSGFSLTHCAA